jgi:HK97 family phage major capsid protein
LKYNEMRELSEKRDKLVKQAQEILSANPDGLSSEDEGRFDGYMAEAEAISEKLPSAAALAKRAAVLSDMVAKEDAESEIEQKSPASSRGAGSKILRRNESYKDYLVKSGRAKNEDREVTLNGFIRGLVGLPCSPAEKRSLGEGTVAGGGAMVPVYLSGMWFDALRAAAVGFKAGAATLDMTSSELDIAKLVSDPTVGWYGENAQITVDSAQSFAKVSLVAKSLATLVQVSIQLYEDAPNAGVLLTNSLTKAMAVGLDSAIFGAGGGNSPTGLKGQAGIGTYSMGVNGAAITNYDPILEAINIMQSANVYSDPTAAVMAPRTAKEFAESKASTNQYLARPDSIARLPFLVTSTIPVNETQGTSNTASSIYVADYSQVIVGLRANIRLQALVERYADFLQVGLLAFLRADVALAHPQAVVRILGAN